MRVCVVGDPDYFADCCPHAYVAPKPDKLNLVIGLSVSVERGLEGSGQAG